MPDLRSYCEKHPIVFFELTEDNKKGRNSKK